MSHDDPHDRVDSSVNDTVAGLRDRATVAADLPGWSGFPQRAVAIDAPGTRFREDALSITRTKGGYEASVFVLDTGNLFFNRSRADVGFQPGLASDAVEIRLLAGPAPPARITMVRHTSVIVIDHMGVLEPEDAASLENLGALVAGWTALGYFEPSADIFWRLARMLVAANRAATEYLTQAGRRLVFRRTDGEIQTKPQMLGDYARFTSPGRRREDRVNIACLLAAWRGDPEPFTAAQLGMIAYQVSRKQDRIGMAKMLEALSADAFRCKIGKSEDGMPVHLEKEFLRRMEAGRLDIRDAAAALSSRRAHPSTETMARILAEVPDDLIGDLMRLSNVRSRVDITELADCLEAEIRLRNGVCVRARANTAAQATILARRATMARHLGITAGDACPSRF